MKTLPGGNRNPWHKHSWAQLTYAIKGVLLVHSDLGTFLAPPHWAVWIPPEVTHEVIASVRTERRNFFIDPSETDWIADRCRVLEVTPLMRELIRAVAALPVAYDLAGPDGRLVRVFLDQLVGLNESQFHLPMPKTPALLESCTNLLRSPDTELTVLDIAKTAALSERTLERTFLRETGLSFREWRVKFKLMMAIGSLEATRNVSTTAYATGYETTSSFIAAFKRQFGKTPGTFLKTLDD
ncbi:AraC family transcriptional regulator [Siculibacillus lacustris]|uniref:AraC family transcriptional regulator n=1 Tax=Siculibacillus lacustris TaxID=1549641 RepID=UPI0019CF50E4|nr:helix-turn-helix transcriptional regulator [Siculibacillus lacustris]